MEYDKKTDLKPLCSGSLFVWSKVTTLELEQRSCDLQKLQLDAVAYLWEIRYDLALVKYHNVSTSPGFESLGLRVNHLKRKRDND